MSDANWYGPYNNPQNQFVFTPAGLKRVLLAQQGCDSQRALTNNIINSADCNYSSGGNFGFGYYGCSRGVGGCANSVYPSYLSGSWAGYGWGGLPGVY